jgi:hypothetical protein
MVGHVGQTYTMPVAQVEGPLKTFTNLPFPITTVNDSGGELGVTAAYIGSFTASGVLEVDMVVEGTPVFRSSTAAGVVVEDFELVDNAVAVVGSFVALGSVTERFTLAGSGSASSFTAAGSVTNLTASELWSAAVVANGGDAPSADTLTAIQTFYDGLFTNGLLGLMKAVNCFAPDNLIAAITPLVVGVGVNPWVNTGFVLGDLTVDGLVGDGDGTMGGGTKSLDTGVPPSAAFTVGCGLSCMVSVASTTTTCYDLGAETAGTYYLDMATGWGENCYAFLFDHSLSEVPGGYAGFFSASRESVDPTHHKTYYTNSGTYANVIQGISAVIAATGMPAYSVAVFAKNSSGTPNSRTDRRLSFVAIHEGLTMAQTQTLYNLVQAMRISFGGGSV